MKSSKYLKDRYQKINELVKLNQYKEAREITEEAIIKEPNDYRLHNLLCMLLIIFKENEKAIDLALHSIKNIKKDAISYFYLGQAQWNSDQKEKGILNIIECLKIDPELQVAYNVLTGYLKIIPSMAFSNNKDIESILLKGIKAGLLKTKDNEGLIIKLYIDNFNSQYSINFMETNPKDNIEDQHLENFINDIFSKDLFLLLLKSVPTSLEILEKYLTEIRKKYLITIFNSQNNDVNTHFLITLAQQSLRNGYSWFICPEEEDILDEIEVRIKKDIKENKKLNENEIAIFASYKHLNNFQEIENYLIKNNNKKLKIHDLINSHIIEISEENKISKKVNFLNIKNKDSNILSNKRFNRPIGYNLLTDSSLTDFIKGTLKPAQILGKQKQINNPKLLLIGETSVAKSIFYSGLEGSKIDVLNESLSEISYASRIVKKNKRKNINFLVGGLDDIDLLKNQYDLIDIYRSINFSADGSKQFEKLCAFLKPGGFMRLELVSQKEYALTENIQKHVAGMKKKNIGFIRNFLRDLNDKEIQLFTKKKKFYDGNSLNNLINEKITNYLSLEKCKILIENQNLKFLGWSRIVDPIYRNSFFAEYNKMFKDDIIYNKLQNWIDFEKEYPFNYSENYSFWLRKEN